MSSPLSESKEESVAEETEERECVDVVGELVGVDWPRVMLRACDMP